jgi:hypothetical protein
MFNLFQRQKHDNRGVEGEDHEQQPANERTRLLPRENDGYLSPDDPAVCTQSVFFFRQAMFNAV